MEHTNTQNGHADTNMIMIELILSNMFDNFWKITTQDTKQMQKQVTTTASNEKYQIANVNTTTGQNQGNGNELKRGANMWQR